MLKNKLLYYVIPGLVMCGCNVHPISLDREENMLAPRPDLTVSSYQPSEELSVYLHQLFARKDRGALKDWLYRIKNAKESNNLSSDMLSTIDFLSSFRDESQRTPLHHIAEWGDPEMLDLLLAAVEKINLEDTDQLLRTPLHYAAAAGNLPTFLRLIRCLNDANALQVIRGVATNNLIGRMGSVGMFFMTFPFIGAYVTGVSYEIGAGQISPLGSAEYKESFYHRKDHKGKTPLMLAVRNNRYDIVDYYVSYIGMSTSWIDIYYRDLLLIAAKNGHTKILKLLLTSGVSLPGDDLQSCHLDAIQCLYDGLIWKDDVTPLLNCAALQGNLEVITLIHEHAKASGYSFPNQSLYEPDNRGRTALHYAVESGDIPTVRYLEEELGFSRYVIDKENRTPISLVAESVNLKMIAYFFEKESPILNLEQFIYCASPVAIEFFLGQLDNQYLDQRLADIFMTVSEVARYNKDRTALDLLIKRLNELGIDSGPQKFHNQVRALQKLVDCCINNKTLGLYQEDELVQSIHLFTKQLSPKQCYLLLKEQIKRNLPRKLKLLYEILNEARPDMDRIISEYKDPNGNTLLHYLPMFGEKITYESLSKMRQSSTNVRNNAGQTPLMTMLESKRIQPHHLTHHLNYFIYGTEDATKRKDNIGNTILHYAVRNPNVNVIKHLFKEQPAVAKSLMNRPNFVGITPILAAAILGNMKVLGCFAHEGANFCITSPKGYSPMHHLAIYGKSGKLPKWLQQRVFLEYSGPDCITPLRAAANYNNQKMVNDLLSAGANPHTAREPAGTSLKVVPN